jgi:hypothetical protein
LLNKIKKGIPLMLITLNELGKFLYKNINGLVAVVRAVAAWLCCCGWRRRGRRGGKQREGDRMASLVLPPVDGEALERGSLEFYLFLN